MPELARRQLLPLHVVLRIGSRQGDRLRPCELEQDSLEGCKAGGIEMLDHLDHGGCVEARQTCVAVHQRTVEQRDALALLRCQPLQLQSRACPLQRAPRYIKPHDLIELGFLQQRLNQSALTATQVEHALGT